MTSQGRINRHADTVEVIFKYHRLRRWPPAEKAALVRRTYEPGMSVSLVARQVGVAASLLPFQLRKLDRKGALMVVSAGEAVVPASELAASRTEIAKLRRVLGKKTLKNEILKEAVAYATEKTVDFVLALVARGRPMKTVCRALGVVRSHVHELHQRSKIWRDARRGGTPTDDAQMLAEIRDRITDLPSYGYRCACALVKRRSSAQSGARVNPKRTYR